MSDRGQKIFKIIVWILIVLGIAFAIYSKINSIMNPAITQAEWKKMLAENFGDERLLELDENAEYVTGEYAALTCMRALGDDRVSYLLDEGNNTDEALVDLAVELEVVSRGDLKNELTEEEADDILLKALGVYFEPEYYPEYCDIETVEDVVDADNWDIEAFDEEKQQMLVKTEEQPQVGDVITYTDEFGIMKARTVSGVSVNEDGLYSVDLDEVEDITQVIEKLSFSGTSDFTYLTSNGSTTPRDDSQSEQTTTLARNTYGAGYPLLLMANMPTVQLAEWEWFDDKTALRKEKDEDSEKCDIEFNVAITETEKNGKVSEKVTAYIKVTSNGLTKTYKYDIDDSGKESFKVSTEAEGLKFDFSENDFKSPSADTSYMKDEYGIAANIKLKGFAVCTSGYYQWSDPDDEKNYVEVLASAEQVNISSSVKVVAEDKYKIGTIPIPIAATAGAVSVNLNVYLVVSASGELTLWYEIDNPYAGVNVSIANGVTPLHGHSNEDAGVRAKIELSGGFIGEAAVMVLDTINLANPGVDARVYASASTIDVKDDYELKDEYLGTTCIELKAQGPIVSISATAGEDSLLYALLNTLKVDATYSLIKKDGNNVPWKVVYHTELDSNGKFSCIKLDDEQSHTDVCTHIQLKEPEVDEEGNILEDIENKVEDEVEKKKREAQEKLREEIEKAIEEALEKFILENCGGC